MLVTVFIKSVMISLNILSSGLTLAERELFKYPVMIVCFFNFYFFSQFCQLLFLTSEDMLLDT